MRWKFIIIWMILSLIASVLRANADTISGCVSELPAEYTFSTSHHLVVGAWEQYAGCDPSGPSARPTGGMYSRVYEPGLMSVTIFASLFNPDCSTQVDIREVNELGEVVAYHDFIYNPTTAGNCGRSSSTGGAWGTSFNAHPPEWPPVDTPLRPPTDVVPVPEPSSMMLLGAGLLYLMRRRA